jgi:hypothetical protein
VKTLKSKRLPLWLSAIGGLLVLPGVLWIAGSGMRLNNDDVSSALNPLTRIHLDRIEDGPVSVTLIIPNTARWTRIRKAWGEPEFVFSAIDPTGQLALCLPKIGARIELRDVTGRVIALRPGSGPYGYSNNCESSSLRFSAAVGDELTLEATKTGEGVSTVPAGDLIVVAEWFNTKDKLVGVGLDKDFESLVKWPSIAGSLLVLSGLMVFVRNRQHSGD